MISRYILFVLLCSSSLFCGCASTRVDRVSLKDAVIESLIEDDKGKIMVITLDRDGSAFIAGRPTTLQEIESLKTLEGRPEKLAILIEADKETRHSGVRAVLDACTKTGIWRIKFKIRKGVE